MIVLSAVLFLCINTKVVVISSIIQCHILFDVSTRVVRDIVYKYCELSSVLPKYVWVEFYYQCKLTTYFLNEKMSIWLGSRPYKYENLMDTIKYTSGL